MARIAKAITAGISAGVGAGVAIIIAAASRGNVGLSDYELALGAALITAGATGWATWRIPNAA